MQANPGRLAWRRDAAVFTAILIGTAVLAAIFALSSPTRVSPASSSSVALPQGLSSFKSDSQLRQYLTLNAKSAQQYSQWGFGFGGAQFFRGGLEAAVTMTSTVTATQTAVSSATSGGSTPSFTGTNVQVQGVDELDRVKTDGTHLFVSTQDSVALINAYPPDSSAIASTLSFPGVSVLGIETSTNRLAVIGQGYSAAPKVELLLYDTSDLASPKLMQNVSIPGSYVAARLANGYLYAIVQQPTYVFDGQGNATAVMPTASAYGVESQLPPSSVYYTNNSAQISYYSMIASLRMSAGREAIQSILTGPSANVYVSPSNIYVVYTNYLDLYNVDGVPGNVWTGGVISTELVQRSQNSTIVRASYSNGTIGVEAAGIVPGTVLNQFSMDEYDGYFRIATSRFAVIDGVATSSDDVYVLKSDMTQVSALKNIAPGENIYAVRFAGETGYVVTFQQIDPLFVISFKDLTHPVILSELKVSGYSDYLHPLPGGYLLGIGKEAVPASQGNFAYYLGLKLSLFQVFANGTSVQVDKMLIGDRGTDSPVLSDHLAFTFDSTRNITVIPLTLFVVRGGQTYDSGVPMYGDAVWQGVYVIRTNASGLTLLGKVSQYPPGQGFGDSPDGSLQVDRSVIIGDYLYTISQSEVMVTALSGFSTVATLHLAA